MKLHGRPSGDVRVDRSSGGSCVRLTDVFEAAGAQQISEAEVCRGVPPARRLRQRLLNTMTLFPFDTATSVALHGFARVWSFFAPGTGSPIDIGSMSMPCCRPSAIPGAHAVEKWPKDRPTRRSSPSSLPDNDCGARRSRPG